MGLFEVGCFPDRGRTYSNKVNKQQNISQEAILHRHYFLKVRLAFLVAKGQVKVYSYF